MPESTPTSNPDPPSSTYMIGNPREERGHRARAGKRIEGGRRPVRDVDVERCQVAGCPLRLGAGRGHPVRKKPPVAKVDGMGWMWRVFCRDGFPRGCLFVSPRVDLRRPLMLLGIFRGSRACGRFPSAILRQAARRAGGCFAYWCSLLPAVAVPTFRNSSDLRDNRVNYSPHPLPPTICL